jgi:hypothetical protein
LAYQKEKIMRRALSVTLIAVCMLGVSAFAPRDARADMTGDWAVDINWVQLFIDACFELTVNPEIVPGVHTSTLAGSGGILIDRGAVIIQLNPSSFPNLLYVGLNYQSPADEAVGGWQENTDVPNWGSHHMVRGACPVASEAAGVAATGG